jgi:hypothetical protein
MARTIGAVCVSLAAGALGLGYSLGGLWAGTLTLGILGLLWLLGYWRGWAWIAPVGLIGCTGAAAAGLLLELRADWMVFGLVAALCAWDLHRFVLRLTMMDRIEDERAMTQRHLGRLLAVAGLGLVFAVVALRIEVRLTFLMALLLGLLAVWGLSRAVSFLRRESD